MGDGVQGGGQGEARSFPGIVISADNVRIIAAVAAGASLREVAEVAGISHTAVKFIAHGRPPRTT